MAHYRLNEDSRGSLPVPPHELTVPVLYSAGKITMEYQSKLKLIVQELNVLEIAFLTLLVNAIHHPWLLV